MINKELTRSIASRSSGVTVTACGIAPAACPGTFLIAPYTNTDVEMSKKEYFGQQEAKVTVPHTHLAP